MKLPDIHDFSTIALYQQATQIRFQYYRPIPTSNTNPAQLTDVLYRGGSPKRICGIVPNRKRASPNPLAAG